MQPPTQPSPEQSPFDNTGEQKVRLQLESLHHLREIVDSNIAEFGEERDGNSADDTKSLYAMLESLDASVSQGDLVAGQIALEQVPRPQKLNEDIRDTLVELHRTERGKATSDQRFYAINNLQLGVMSEISTLTDPKKGDLRYTDPEVQARIAVRTAFTGRHRSYYDDTQPEDELFQNGEQRTPHQVAEDSYNLLLAYTEDKLRQPDLAPIKAEELRVARDKLHLERKNLKKEFDTQNEAVDAVMQMMGSNNELFNEAQVRAAIRDCVGDTLSRLQELIEVARHTTNQFERFNLLNGVQRERSPIESAEAFDTWKQKRAEKAKITEETNSAVMANDSRKAIAAIRSSAERPANQAAAVLSVAATPEHQEAKEIVVAPVPTGWTELVHGTNSTRWQHSGDTIEITGAGLSAISLEDIVHGGGKATDSYSRTPDEGGQPIEVRVSFYRVDLSPRLGVRPDAAELKAGLSKDTLELIARYHQDRHPLIPRGETLLKIGESVNVESGRQVEHYVPRSVAKQYVEAVKIETGRDIVLPSAEQSIKTTEAAQSKLRKLVKRWPRY
jgi:hypothetical protein